MKTKMNGKIAVLIVTRILLPLRKMDLGEILLSYRDKDRRR